MTTAADRALLGRAARRQASRSSHGLWIPAADRPDPLAVLARRNATRLPDLLPLRYARLAASPFAFLRGAAAVMAVDLAHGPRTGLTVQLCGDAHLLNFGFFASPEHALLFDMAHFAETLPGPFEWDVKRLAASIAVAARDGGQSDGQARHAVLAAVGAYRSAVRGLADLGELDVWFRHLDTSALLPPAGSGGRAPAVLTAAPDGRLRIAPDPPLLEPVGRIDTAALRRIFIGYRSTLPEDRRVLLDRFRFVDVARKVEGVGGVGTRCYLVLLEGRDSADPLLLQIEEAEPSALEPHLRPGVYAHEGHRIVAGQRLLQAVADPFLGWVTGPEGRHFYWRRPREAKGVSAVDGLTPALLTAHAALCGAALARAHARSGDRIAIASYLGSADTFDRALADFALRYTDRNALDHAALRAAVTAGRITAAAPGPAGGG